MSEIIPEDVLIEFDQQNKHISKLDAWNRVCEKANDIFERSENALGECDSRFNSIFWTFHVWTLLKEIVHGLCWMRAWAKYYKQNVRPQDGLSHHSPYVSYYASDCMIRIHSCRDKLSIMALTFYLPLNPEKEEDIRSFWPNIKTLSSQEVNLPTDEIKAFKPYLEILRNDDFTKIEIYRNLKIHRREPIIEMYGAAPHHDWSYVFQVEDIDEFAKRMMSEYPDPNYRA